ncbi:MAG: hypothetical protein ACKERF_01565 [Candidatus Hodgkinia cicadicola]
MVPIEMLSEVVFGSIIPTFVTLTVSSGDYYFIKIQFKMHFISMFEWSDNFIGVNDVLAFTEVQGGNKKFKDLILFNTTNTNGTIANLSLGNL